MASPAIGTGPPWQRRPRTTHASTHRLERRLGGRCANIYNESCNEYSSQKTRLSNTCLFHVWWAVVGAQVGRDSIIAEEPTYSRSRGGEYINNVIKTARSSLLCFADSAAAKMRLAVAQLERHVSSLKPGQPR